MHRATLQSIRTFNSSIVAVHAFEVNQKVINEIAIKEALGEALTVSNMTALENIAAQPDSVAGSTQRTAANMLFPCVEQSADLRSNAFESIPNTTIEKGRQYWVLSPNPSSGLAQITFSAPYSGTLHITDQFGRLVMQQTIQEQTVVQIQGDELPNGLYWVHAINRVGEKRAIKMVIVH